MMPSRILFIAEGQLGDLLVLTPAIRAMKNTFNPANISVLIFQRRPYFRSSGETPYYTEDPQSGAAAVLRGNPNIDELIEVDLLALRHLSWFSRAIAEVDIMVRLRKKRFDTAIVFPRDRFVLWAYISGANNRVGQQEQVYHQLLTHHPRIHKSDAGVISYYCNLVASLGAAVDSFETEFFVPESARQSAQEFLERHGIGVSTTMVAVHPGASANDRIWPPERYASLIDTLHADPRIRVLLCTSSFDRGIVDRVLRGTGTHPVLVDTHDDIAPLAALLERCALFIGNNSGPRHLAAAVGAPTLALLTRNDEREWEAYKDTGRHRIVQGSETCPVCPGNVCQKKLPDNEEYGSYCMRMISMETVVAKVREMLHPRWNTGRG
jgi:ADP-heptose:LPS heptosyltransferase